MYDIDGVYRRLSTAKKCGQAIKHEIFLRHWLLQTPGEIKKTERSNKILTKVLPGESIIL